MIKVRQETRRNAEFRRLLLESIDKGLRDTFSERTSKEILALIETRFGIKYEELPERIHDFEKGLTTLFGRSTPVLTRVFVRILCAKLDVRYHPYRGPFRVEDNFETYVKDCLRRWNGDVAG